MQNVHFFYMGKERKTVATGAYRFPRYLCALFIDGCIGNRYGHTGSFLTTTMVKESFCAGNKQVSPKGQAGYLIRGYYVDKLQEIVISDWMSSNANRSLVI